MIWPKEWRASGASSQIPRRSPLWTAFCGFPAAPCEGCPSTGHAVLFHFFSAAVKSRIISLVPASIPDVPNQTHRLFSSRSPPLLPVANPACQRSCSSVRPRSGALGDRRLLGHLVSRAMPWSFLCGLSSSLPDNESRAELALSGSLPSQRLRHQRPPCDRHIHDGSKYSPRTSSRQASRRVHAFLCVHTGRVCLFPSSFRGEMRLAACDSQTCLQCHLFVFR